MNRLTPFSHISGSRCLIPGTHYLVEAYPALIRIRDLEGEIVKERPLDVHGPLKQFTLMQELNRGYVRIFSESYKLYVDRDLNITEKKPPSLLGGEMLFLGCFKKQEWEKLRARKELNELLPLWFRLGSLLKLPPREENEGGLLSLLEPPNHPEEIAPRLKALFLAGFYSMMVPRREDTDYQAILPQDTPPLRANPLYLLSEGAALIRSFFYRFQGDNIFFLPSLPPECFAGQFLNLEGWVDIEWSKKCLRRVSLRPSYSRVVTLHFQSGLKTYRLGRHERSCLEPLEIKAGEHYVLDRFQK